MFCAISHSKEAFAKYSLQFFAVTFHSQCFLYKNGWLTNSVHNLWVLTAKCVSPTFKISWDVFGSDWVSNQLNQVSTEGRLRVKFTAIALAHKGCGKILQHLKRKTGFYIFWSKIVHLHLPWRGGVWRASNVLSKMFFFCKIHLN